ncbi:YD repeat-containing protein [Yersinia aldovae]|nr:RHS repeat-associated core domain-containing protein [Yersinia aldovae]CNH96732.1 YD repeat-containing protein [Yersinia aldovae]
MRADFGGFLPLQEQFSYDANHNLTWQARLPRGATAVLEQDAQQQLAGRVISRGNNQYHYDNAGRLSEKRELKDGFRPQVWRYRWDEQDQLSELITPRGERWRYGYDAFGRRIRKLRLISNAPAASNQGEPTASEKTAQVGYEYLWSGDQLIEEVPIYSDGTAAYEQSIHWLYAPGALTPTARYENGKLHYVVADHLGTPRELLNEQGKVVWANRLSTWGRAELWRQAANDEDNVTCNLRFAGQYADAESGLHYNRFRYYDGETGQYLCPDPIGLLGGVNPYAYVHNPLGWVDPLGLVAASTPGYNVYGLYEVGASKPYYIGITNDLDVRAAQHRTSGRLGTGSEMLPIDRNITYGQARGHEQAYIEHYETKTGIRGESISSTNRGNKINSYDHNNSTRDPARQQYFEDAYQGKMNELNNSSRSNVNNGIGGKCG